MAILVLFLILEVILADDIIHNGEHGYSTYFEGTGPLIITSHHNGPLEPTLIPNRHPGCFDGTDCIWEHNCSPQDSSNCGITTVTDSYTKDLATCIYNNVEIFNSNNEQLKPHLIINEIRRTKLDPNRQIGEAAQGNSRAEQTWKEIHQQWADMAKNININNCGFGGLLIDIHGQASNDFINLGYRLTRSTVNLNDFELNDQFLDEISIKSSIIDNEMTISESIRGEWALGTIISNYGYDVLPSKAFPTIPNDVPTYFAGATVSTLAIHGSQNSESVTDAIQVEVNRDLRFDEDIRKQFCLDFSNAIELYLNRWYDLQQCNINGNLKQSIGTISNGTTNTDKSIEKGNVTFGALTISLIGIGFIVILGVVCLMLRCFRNSVGKSMQRNDTYVEMIADTK